MRTVYLIDRTDEARPPAGFLAMAASVLRTSLWNFSVDWFFAHTWTTIVVARGLDVPPKLRPGDFGIVISDTADSEGALGYHSTNPDGTPMVKVFAKTILDDGGTWHQGADSVMVCADHEAKETVLDMPASLYGFDWHGRAWAYESSDAVQSSVLPAAHGYSVSNYVLPSYFDLGAPGPWDKLGRLPGPFSIDRGGYAIVADLQNERESFADLDAMGFRLVGDEHGPAGLILDPEYRLPAALKADGSSRTMRRLGARHDGS